MIDQATDIPRSIEGAVTCSDVAGRSALTQLYSCSPLKLIATEPIGRAAHVVMSSFGGGMVTGDTISIELRVEANARCVFTTQSASKVYRSVGDGCMQSINATIGDGALLAVLPDPLSCFGDAKFIQNQQYNLSSQANLVWLDWITAGRWARNERWQFDSYESVTDIKIVEKLLVRETLLLDDSDNPSSLFKMGKFNCYAVMVVVGPLLKSVVEHLKISLNAEPISAKPSILASFTSIAGGAVVRLIGPDAQTVQDRLRPIVALLASVIGGDPWARKW